ncbi:hypothetical protein AAFF_G00117090 [Aldrovandia affinis]|uniref:Uncharacterized protein n=1 Tax=Aldrovandia affinis TaxID=143900 RepID=A0AAD7T2D7_9TELE|nr:hypothetical protein AAFF_G00117090 [Aldrovandia affinis]
MRRIADIQIVFELLTPGKHCEMRRSGRNAGSLALAFFAGSAPSWMRRNRALHHVDTCEDNVGMINCSLGDTRRQECTEEDIKSH